MAETIGVKLPNEMTTLIEEIRSIRAERFEPTSNKSIIIDAVKAFHEALLCHVTETQSQGM